MGILITGTTEKPIQISGTDLEVPTAYARIYMACNPDGITISIGYQIYASKEMFSEAKPLSTDIPNQSFNVDLDPATQEQSITVGLEYAKVGFEQMGYTAAVDPTA